MPIADALVSQSANDCVESLRFHEHLGVFRSGSVSSVSFFSALDSPHVLKEKRSAVRPARRYLCPLSAGGRREDLPARQWASSFSSSSSLALEHRSSSVAEVSAERGLDLGVVCRGTSYEKYTHAIRIRLRCVRTHRRLCIRSGTHPNRLARSRALHDFAPRLSQAFAYTGAEPGTPEESSLTWNFLLASQSVVSIDFFFFCYSV